MNVLIKSVSGKIPEYKTHGACAFDFESLTDVTINPNETALIDTGTVIGTPVGYCLVTAPRSSIYKNYGLILVNSIGIIDQDYCGDNDTVKFMYLNLKNEPVTIKAWERVWQWMFVKIEKAEFIPLKNMNSPDRWGYGTTGK